MSATAEFTLSCTVSGFPEGGTNAGFYTTFGTTQAVGEWRTTVVTTVAANMPVINPPSSCCGLFIKPVDSTNVHPIRLQSSTSTALSGVGVTLSSLLPSFISLTPAATTLYLWTTATSAAGGGAPSINVRLAIF